MPQRFVLPPTWNYLLMWSEVESVKIVIYGLSSWNIGFWALSLTKVSNKPWYGLSSPISHKYSIQFKFYLLESKYQFETSKSQILKGKTKNPSTYLCLLFKSSFAKKKSRVFRLTMLSGLFLLSYFLCFETTLIEGNPFRVFLSNFQDLSIWH